MGNAIKKDETKKRKVTKKSYYWATICYPESCKPEFKDILAEKKIPCAVSPLHDRDINEDGTPKKPHYHIVFAFPSQKSNLQIEDIVSAIGGVGCENVMDIGAYTRYLTHDDDEDKAQYSKDDIAIIGGFDYAKLSARKLDAVDAFGEIIDMIENNALRTYTEVVRCAKQNRPELMKVCMDKSYAIGQYLRGINQSEQREAKRKHDIQVACMEHLIAEGWKPVSKADAEEIWGKQETFL